MADERIVELDEALSVVNDELMALRDKQDKLLKQKRNYIKEKLKVLVGKCFHNEEKKMFFIVTSVPNEQFFKAGESFNPYQIPVYSITTQSRDFGSWTDYGEVTYDTIFSRCCEADDVLAAFIAEGNTELTIQKFKTFVNEMVGVVIDHTWENC